MTTETDNVTPMDTLYSQLELAKQTPEARVIDALNPVNALETVALVPNYAEQCVAVVSTPSFNELPADYKNHLIDGMHIALDLLRPPSNAA